MFIKKSEYENDIEWRDEKIKRLEKRVGEIDKKKEEKKLKGLKEIKIVNCEVCDGRGLSSSMTKCKRKGFNDMEVVYVCKDCMKGKVTIYNEID